jgi:DNA anti-recombination protein RmuC
MKRERLRCVSMSTRFAATIKSLSDKQYQALYGKSLDFVLAFVPIEPAFMLAVWG